MDKKIPAEHVFADVAISPSDTDSSVDVDGYGSNTWDKLAMTRMGKTQEMRRNFKQVPLIGFTCMCMCTWEWMIMSNSQALINGGGAALFWGYIWTFVGYGFIAASLADMASMAPTAGGQYHWTSEFAPKKYQRFLSYFSGWLAALSWQAGNASGMFIQGLLIQALIGMRNPEYAAPAWQGWLLVVASTVASCIINIFAENLLPRMQYAAMTVHVTGFIATIAVLWALAPHVDAEAALLIFDNEGGWPTTGLALMVGQLSAVFALGGSDSAAHMSEEAKNSGMTVARAMVWSISINGLMGLIAVVSFVFAMPSLTDAINDPSGFPMIYVYRLAGGNDVAICLVLIQLILCQFGNISYQASTARQTFAFARDGGFPFSKWVARVHPSFKIPVNAVIVTGAFSILVTLINLGSADAFNAILSLFSVAQMATYSLSISCVLWRRLTAPEILPEASWGLGRWGALVNGVAVAYAWFTWFWMFWPTAVPLSGPGDMNWAVVMFFGVLAIAMIHFLIRARKTYFGPVTKVAGWVD